MKWFISKAALFAVFLLLSPAGFPNDPYGGEEEKHVSGWNKLIPGHMKAQFAGSMGLFSVGPGWSYSKGRLETDILLGYLPGYSDSRPKMTMTLRQNYMPWKKYWSEDWTFEPLACGLYINTIFDRRFWFDEPSKYPKGKGGGYYKFSSKVRFHVYLGQRITYNLRKEKKFLKSITAYYEISSCDLYIISKITNKCLKPYDYLGISFGVKAQVF